MTNDPNPAAAPVPAASPPAPPPTPPPAEPPGHASAPPTAAAASGDAPKPTAPAAPAAAPKSHLKRNLILGGVGLLVLALLVWAFYPKPLTVEVASVTQGTFERAVQEYGKTRVRDRYTVSAPVAGRVGRVLLKQGDSVALGDTVALLWPMAPALLDERTRAEQAARINAMASGLARSQANVSRAVAALDQADAELKRSEALARQGFVSPTQNEAGRITLRLRTQELESVRQEEDAARHELEQSQSARRQFAQAPLGGQQPSFAVKAPVGGKVLKVLQQSEASVLAGSGGRRHRLIEF